MLYQAQGMPSVSSSKVTGYTAWCIATSIQKHFEGSYDAVKYNYKMKWLTTSAFARRRDQYFYQRLVRKYSTKESLIKYFVANTLAGNTYITDCTDEAYEEFNSKLQSISYLFKSDLKNLDVKQFDDLFKINQMPYIVEEMFAGKVSLETVTILDYWLDFTNVCDKKTTDVLIWPEQKARIQNYKTVIPLCINTKKLKEIIKNVFTT